MAGSLDHIVGKNMEYTEDLIDDMGDALEALEDCYNVALALAWVMDSSGADGFSTIEKDRWDFAMDEAFANDREEPNDRDYMMGAIRCAVAAMQKEKEDV